ncbi:helix-turn-helix transcriptional regulator [Streptomyces sp. NPDC086182]|uniref:helix-turn-helix transcriptional regulator n=1 Tax=Streptomyces sp. NPDC086182 TaxID=3155058 RepID=UPI00341B6573
MVRYALRDLDYFKKTMKHPGRGVPFEPEELAKKVGISRSQMYRILAGHVLDLPVNEAHAVAGALGVAVLVLFVPPASPTQ